MEDEREQVEPIIELERFIHYQRRQVRLTYHVPLVASKPVISVVRVEQTAPIVVAKMKVKRRGNTVHNQCHFLYSKASVVGLN